MSGFPRAYNYLPVRKFFLDVAGVTVAENEARLPGGGFTRRSFALTLPVSAPGSAGMEACFVNLVEPGDKVIVCQNGVFGGRMKENVERCGGEAVMEATFVHGSPYVYVKAYQGQLVIRTLRADLVAGFTGAGGEHQHVGWDDGLAINAVLPALGPALAIFVFLAAWMIKLAVADAWSLAATLLVPHARADAPRTGVLPVVGGNAALVDPALGRALAEQGVQAALGPVRGHAGGVITQHAAMQPLMPPPEASVVVMAGWRLAQIWQAELTGLELSFWAAFGAGQILLEPWIYEVLRWVKYLVLVGGVIGVWQAVRWQAGGGKWQASSQSANNRIQSQFTTNYSQSTIFKEAPGYV